MSPNEPSTGGKPEILVRLRRSKPITLHRNFRSNPYDSVRVGVFQVLEHCRRGAVPSQVLSQGHTPKISNMFSHK